MSLSDLPRILVKAGPHDRREAVTAIRMPDLHPVASYELLAPDGTILALQRLDQENFVFLLPSLAAGQSLPLQVQPVSNLQTADSQRVAMEADARGITIRVGDTLLTRYHFVEVPARPYFYPLLSGSGHQMTRAYPMRDDVPNEAHDHPHHRSLWIAFGEVAGTDNWSEGAGHGFTRHQAVTSCESGEVFGRFKTHGVWTSAQDVPLLNQSLTVTAWATPAPTRLLDFDVELHAAYGDIPFGDTKEGGILALRVTGELDVPRGGKIENSYGGVNEAETWGKAAHWCDYSGIIDGKALGVAILDHPLSFRYPTHWHVRNYGLMTANPFGYAAYTNGIKEGSHTLNKGESLRFRYRLVIHEGDATHGEVRAKYLDWVAPPKTEWLSPLS